MSLARASLGIWVAVFVASGCVRPLPDELTLLVTSEPSLVPGGAAAPVEVRVVCPSCAADALDELQLVWGRLEQPGDARLTGAFTPVQPSWTNQLVVSASPAVPRGTVRGFSVQLVNRGSRKLVRSAAVPVHVEGADFTLAAEPAAVALPPGGLGAVRVRVTRSAGFTGPVALVVEPQLRAVGGEASGATAELLAGDEAGAERLVLLRAGAAPAGVELLLRVSGSSQTTEQGLDVPVAVDGAAERLQLSVSTSPPGLVVPRGEARPARVQLRSRAAAPLEVTLAVAGLPAGVTAQLSPAQLSVGPDGGVATLTVSAAALAQPAVSAPRVVAVAGELAVDYGLVLTVPGTAPDAGDEPDEDGGGPDDGGLDAGLPDGGGLDAGLPDGGGLDAGGGPNLLRCECGDLTFAAPFCTAVACFTTAPLTDECARACGDAGTYMHQCTPAAAQCGGASMRDAGAPTGTTQVLCDCSDGLPPLPVCTDLSCSALFTVVLQAQRCAEACGPSAIGVASVGCTSNTLVCGGDGGSPPGNGFFCACGDGRRTGVCGGQTTCFVGGPFLPTTCPDFCDGGFVQQLDCVVEHPECQPGVTTFTWDAGAVDAGPADAGAVDAGPVDAGAVDAGAVDAGFDAGPSFAWGVAQLSAGWNHVCALTDGGAVYCWGKNPRFGDPVAMPARHLTPTRVDGLPVITQLTSGNQTTCALDATGQVWCFGTNVAALNALQPDGGSWGPAVADAGALRFGAITLGGSALCGLTLDGGTYCWGGNLNAALGRGFTSAQELEPAPPDGGGPYVEVASGPQHSCARTAGGQVWCWGLIPPRSTLSALPVSTTQTFRHVAAGNQFSCGLERVTSRAWCWGQNVSGQGGVASPVALGAPTAVSGALEFLQLTAGASHSCGVTDAGHGYCWGLASFGRLGNAQVSNTYPSPQGLYLDPLVTQIVAGQIFTCALARDNRILCWGYSGDGELGPGTLGSSRTFPIEVVR